jgi:hypothetical protein
LAKLGMFIWKVNGGQLGRFKEIPTMGDNILAKE